jgi:2-polyprenyl-6-methoxyphenol hydroxylase-like FAD-dependent oxidoreductase
MRRVVVAGAGPAGAAAAMALGGSGGIECVLVEQRSIPRTKVRGGGLSPRTLTVLDQLGVGGEVAAHERRVRERLGRRMAGGWLLRAGLYTPLIDDLSYLQSLRPVRKLVLGAFAGRYHG